MKKNLLIEGFRGVLILWIILFHYTTRFGELFGKTINCGFPNGGEVGVTMFFILSGCFFARSVLDEKRYGLKEFVYFSINKYWRLYPAYLLSVILIYFITAYLGGLENREVDVETFLINLFLIYHPSIDYVDGAHWFIAALIKIQIICATLLLVRKRRNLILNIFAMITISIILFLKIVPCFFLNNILRVLFDSSLISFLCGMLFYIALNEREKKYWIFPIILGGALSIKIHLFLLPLYLGIFMILYSKNKYVLLFEKIHLFNSNIFLFIGSISFLWYLIHQNIGYALMLKIYPISEFLAVLLALITTFLIAVLINYCVSRIPQKIL